MSGARAWGRCRQPKCGRSLTLRWVQQAQQGHLCVKPIKSLYIEAAVNLQHRHPLADLLPAKGQKSCSSLTANPSSGLDT